MIISILICLPIWHYINVHPSDLKWNLKKNWQCELKKGKSSKNSPVSTEDKSPFLNYDYEEVPFLPYESYEDYYSSVVAETTHGGEF